jgi:hypothetical protein
MLGNYRNSRVVLSSTELRVVCTHLEGSALLALEGRIEDIKGRNEMGRGAGGDYDREACVLGKRGWLAAP